MHDENVEPIVADAEQAPEITTSGAPNPAAVDQIIAVLTAGNNVIDGPKLTESSPGVLFSRGKELLRSIS